MSDESNDVSPLNHQVRVEVRGAVGQVRVGPNPIIPVFSHMEPDLVSHDPNEAYQWAKQGGGGIFAAEVVLPGEPGTMNVDNNFSVNGVMMIFDAIGNLVYSRKSATNLVPDEWYSGGVAGERRQLVFYWNGITDKNMKAAPGIYRVILTLDFGREKRKYKGNLGIGR
jgi:hypothetical protein